MITIRIEKREHNKNIINIHHMAKQRIYKFTDGNEINEEITAMSWKKAVKSFQNKVKAKLIYIEWISKKGIEMTKWQTLPIGRKDKLGK